MGDGAYADAARAFSKTLDLDPKNAAARSSLPIATAKAQRYAMEQARAALIRKMAKRHAVGVVRKALGARPATRVTG